MHNTALSQTNTQLFDRRMAQFDVHLNIGKHRADIPYVVVVQSSLYEAYRRRVVVPLVRKSVIGKVANPRLNPTFKIQSISVVLHPLEIVSVANEQLGERVMSLAAEGQQIIDALDELLTRAWQ
jgi:toxin CcdB